MVLRPSRRPTVPPITITVPSSRNDWPAQKRLAGSSSPPGIFGGYTARVVFVTGSSRNARPEVVPGEVEDLAGVQHHGVHRDAGDRELGRPLADLRGIGADGRGLDRPDGRVAVVRGGGRGAGCLIGGGLLARELAHARVLGGVLRPERARLDVAQPPLPRGRVGRSGMRERAAGRASL